MFTKAEIEIYDLKFNDIIVTSEWDHGDTGIGKNPYSLSELNDD